MPKVGKLVLRLTTVTGFIFLLSLGIFPVHAQAFLEVTGTVSNFGPTTITGIACDPDDYSQTVTVNFYVDSYPAGYVGQIAANQPTASSIATTYCNGTANHGFTFTWPTPIQPGQSVTAYALNIPNGSGSAGSVIGSYTFPNASPSPKTCPAAAKVLMYDLQPHNENPYENYSDAFVQIMNNAGYTFTHGNRADTPTITLAYLQQYDVAYFFNGCGGATGLFSTTELDAIKQYYLSGKNLMLVADDSSGDSVSPGSCQDRVNQIATNLGATFSSYALYPSNSCQTLTKPGNSSLLNNINSMSFYSPGLLNISGTVAWGSTTPTAIAQLSDGNIVLAYTPANSTHGSVVFMPDSGELTTMNTCNTNGMITFWNNYLQDTVCKTNPSPTPGLPGICLNITYTPTQPKYGDNVTFTCGPLAAATRYEFSYAVFNKTTNQQVTTGTIAPATTGSNISQSLPITEEGIYKVVCRACDQNSCTPFEPFN